MQKEEEEEVTVAVPQSCVVAVPPLDNVAANVRNILAKTYFQFKQSWLQTKASICIFKPLLKGQCWKFSVPVDSVAATDCLIPHLQ